jgi:hypothetical protein
MSITLCSQCGSDANEGKCQEAKKANKEVVFGCNTKTSHDEQRRRISKYLIVHPVVARILKGAKSMRLVRSMCHVMH